MWCYWELRDLLHTGGYINTTMTKGRRIAHLRMGRSSLNSYKKQPRSSLIEAIVTIQSRSRACFRWNEICVFPAVDTHLHPITCLSLYPTFIILKSSSVWYFCFETNAKENKQIQTVMLQGILHVEVFIEGILFCGLLIPEDSFLAIKFR